MPQDSLAGTVIFVRSRQQKTDTCIVDFLQTNWKPDVITPPPSYTLDGSWAVLRQLDEDEAVDNARTWCTRKIDGDGNDQHREDRALFKKAMDSRNLAQK